VNEDDLLSELILVSVLISISRSIARSIIVIIVSSSIVVAITIAWKEKLESDGFLGYLSLTIAEGRA